MGELAAEMILVGVSTGDWCDIFRLSKSQQTTIGRSSDNDIVIRSDRCSRQHATVFCDHGEWFIRDLDSSNGTRLNGKRIKGSAQIKRTETRGRRQHHPTKKTLESK